MAERTERQYTGPVIPPSPSSPQRPVSPSEEGALAAAVDEEGLPRRPAPTPAPAFPVVTVVLVVVLGLIFGMEMLLGGAGSPTLAHMGANVVARTRAGEVDRLLAASTLHVAPWHAVMNLYVLYSLGRQLEPLFGRSRFLLLYFASAVGGGIGTTMLGDAGVSAGASGAIWGLLTASAVLAFRPPPSWSPQMIQVARRNAMTNLALNIGISFVPGIDKWAHFGGGFVGALLVGLGILVPPRWTLARTGAPEPRSHTLALSFAAGLLTLATVASVGVAWMRGRPWELLDPPVLARTLVMPSGVSMELPIELSPAGTPETYGDLSTDRMVVQVLGTEPLGATAMELEAGNAMMQLDGFVPEGSSPLGPAQRVDAPSGPTILRAYRAGEELTIVRAVALRPGRAIILDVVTWTAYVDARALTITLAASIPQ